MIGKFTYKGLVKTELQSASHNKNEKRRKMDGEQNKNHKNNRGESNNIEMLKTTQRWKEMQHQKSKSTKD